MSEEPTRRIPIELIEAVNRMVRASRAMLKETGREPTPDELAERLGCPVEEVRKLLALAKEPFPRRGDTPG
jgi:RNA polymerase primary sigma factor